MTPTPLQEGAFRVTTTFVQFFSVDLRHEKIAKANNRERITFFIAASSFHDCTIHVLVAQ
jgi:hypothetical protein